MTQEELIAEVERLRGRDYYVELIRENDKLREVLADALEYLEALQGEWDWKADEPRAGNQADYERLVSVVAKVKELIG